MNEIDAEKYFDELIYRLNALKKIYCGLSERKKGYPKKLSFNELESYVNTAMFGMRDYMENKKFM